MKASLPRALPISSRHMAVPFLLPLVVLLMSHWANAFSPSPNTLQKHYFRTHQERGNALISTRMMDPSGSIMSASSLPSLLSIAADTDGASWRQYVPLVVSVAVIIDVLLGRPVANSVLAPLQQVKEELSASPNTGVNKKERVDSNAIAQEALEQARLAIELREYLEENKTEEQRLSEIKADLEEQTRNLEQSLDRQRGEKHE